MLRMSMMAWALAALSPLWPTAHEHHAAPSAGASMPAEVETETLRADKARNYFTDLPVIAQDGKQRRFFSDVLKDKVVLIYLFYTNCENTCPVINQTLAHVQKLLGQRLGSEINLVSITTDPVRDTPPVVREYSEYFGPLPGWFFLTGERQYIETIVGRLGHTSPDPTAHTTYLMVGNVAKGRWTKLKPTASETEIVAMLHLLAEAGDE